MLLRVYVRITGRNKGLVNHGCDNARNQIPIRVEFERNHWLDIECVLIACIRTDILINVVLERNADQTGDWILGSFLQAFCGGTLCGSTARWRSTLCNTGNAGQEKQKR